MGWYDGNPGASVGTSAGRDRAAVRRPTTAGSRHSSRRAADTPTPATSGSPRPCSTTPYSPSPVNDGAKEALAQVYERLGHGAENGTWRNFYLTGAQELRKGPTPTPIQSASPEMMTALTLEMIIDSLAVRVDGLRAAAVDFTMDWELTDENTLHRITLSNGALTHRAPTPEAPAGGPADLTLTLTKEQLLKAVSGSGFDGVTMTGDRSLLETFIGLLRRPRPAVPHRHTMSRGNGYRPCRISAAR